MSKEQAAAFSLGFSLFVGPVRPELYERHCNFKKIARRIGLRRLALSPSLRLCSLLRWFATGLESLILNGRLRAVSSTGAGFFSVVGDTLADRQNGIPKAGNISNLVSWR
ncbi:MAG TPA: hypothetical protein VGF89_04550 [Steroidobacteraceae bacterium]|jgi:hypothetical protein